MKNFKIIDNKTGEIIKSGYKIVKIKSTGDYYKKSSVIFHDEIINDMIIIRPLLNLLIQYMRRETNIVTFDSRFSKQDLKDVLGISDNYFRWLMHIEKTMMTLTKINSISYMLNPNYFTKAYGEDREKLIQNWNRILLQKTKTAAQKKIEKQRIAAKKRKAEKEARKKLRLVYFNRKKIIG